MVDVENDEITTIRSTMQTQNAGVWLLHISSWHESWIKTKDT